MVAGLAIGLPIVLAVMGVIVALKPPPAAGFIHWAWVMAFVVVGGIAIVVGIQDRRNGDAKQQKMESTIDGLRDAISKLTKPISTPSVPTRDPDMLYQNGNRVGEVIAPRITLNESQIYFDQINNAGTLNPQKPFEYRGYVLKFVRADSYIGTLFTSGGIIQNVYQHVVCEIVGRVH